MLYAPGGETRPYQTRVSLSQGGREWAYYIRKHSSTVRARGEDERELLGLAATVPFDDRYHRNASLDDLSFRLIQQHLQDVGSDLLQEVATLSMDVLGRRMNIVGGPSEALFPKNVGLLFFNDHPYEFFPATQIDVVWFPDGPGGDYFEEKEFRGPVAAILRDAVNYIERNFLKEAVVKQPHQPEAQRFWNFPIAAIEESLGNAVYHRSYEEREPVEVRITPEGNAGLELSRRGPLDPDGGLAARSGGEPQVPQSPNRRVPQGTRPRRGSLDRRAEDPASDAQQRLTRTEVRDRR